MAEVARHGDSPNCAQGTLFIASIRVTLSSPTPSSRQSTYFTKVTITGSGTQFPLTYDIGRDGVTTLR